MHKFSPEFVVISDVTQTHYTALVTSLFQNLQRKHKGAKTRNRKTQNELLLL